MWDLYEQRGAQMQQLDEAESAGVDAEAAGAGDTADGGGGGGGGHGGGEGEGGEYESLDVEALHARLRRRMRHSMHVLMQQHNPDSYYKDVVHVEPT